MQDARPRTGQRDSGITTAGFGDRSPVTLEGQLIAFALMLVGISLAAGEVVAALDGSRT